MTTKPKKNKIDTIIHLGIWLVAAVLVVVTVARNFDVITRPAEVPVPPAQVAAQDAPQPTPARMVEPEPDIAPQAVAGPFTAAERAFLDAVAEEMFAGNYLQAAALLESGGDILAQFSREHRLSGFRYRDEFLFFSPNRFDGLKYLHMDNTKDGTGTLVRIALTKGDEWWQQIMRAEYIDGRMDGMHELRIYRGGELHYVTTTEVADGVMHGQRITERLAFGAYQMPTVRTIHFEYGMAKALGPASQFGNIPVGTMVFRVEGRIDRGYYLSPFDHRFQKIQSPYCLSEDWARRLRARIPWFV